MPTEAQIQTLVDNILTQYQQSTIVFYPYTTGSSDIYKQRTKTFGTAVPLVGRAILNPSKEEISGIGNVEEYDVAFLFSQLEMNRKFPSAAEGEWVDVKGKLTWFSRRFKIEKVHPSGQVGTEFSLVIVLGKTIPGSRD